jgi:hypothetical protein
LSPGGERVVAELHARGALEITAETIAGDCLPFTRIGLKLKEPVVPIRCRVPV